MPIRLAFRSGALLVLFSALSLAGCARPRAIVELRQPFAPPSQQRIELSSPWSFTSVAGDRRTSLLAFPLPGAAAGSRDFLIFVETPGQTGDYLAGTGEATGFLIQAIGRFAGKCCFSDGSVKVRPVAFASHLRRIDLDVRCDDGTQIVGSAVLRDAPGELRVFERRHAADVASLRTRGSEAAPVADATGPRPESRRPLEATATAEAPVHSAESGSN